MIIIFCAPPDTMLNGMIKHDFSGFNYVGYFFSPKHYKLKNKKVQNKTLYVEYVDTGYVKIECDAGFYADTTGLAVFAFADDPCNAKLPAGVIVNENGIGYYDESCMRKCFFENEAKIGNDDYNECLDQCKGL